jgi:hypothetical protein
MRTSGAKPASDPHTARVRSVSESTGACESTPAAGDCRNKSGQQHQIWSNSEILLAQISVCLRFLAGAHVFEAAEIQIREQILNPCLLLASGLRIVTMYGHVGQCTM